MDPTITFFCLVLIGFILIAAEVFVPGGVLGIIGFICIIGAIVFGFKAFGSYGGTIAMAILIVASGAFVVGWLYIFPRTAIGKSLTLSDNFSEAKANPDESDLLDKEGVATSNLGPAGIVEIDNQRLDVVAESSWIESGSKVRVIAVTGNRVVVRQIES